MLHLYRRAIWARKREASLHSGAFREVGSPAGTLAFIRRAPGHAPVFVAMSTSVDDVVITLPEGYSKVLLATERQAEGRFVEGEITLPGLAAIMVLGPSSRAV